MIFSASPWLFFLIAVPGLWLSYRVYLGGSGPALEGRWKRVLAGLSAAAWVALAGFAIQPLWRLNPEIYHPPAVVLAVDESPSYAALGTHASAGASLGEARKHYESLGFKVYTLGFGETVTRITSLRRALDSLSLPNLQAVLVWTDGRFLEGGETMGANEADEGAVSGNWPAPVFPVRVASRGNEVQGESATITFLSPGRPEQGAEMEIAWRGAGTPSAEAVAELRAAGKTLWTQKLHRPAGNSPEAQVTAVFPLPAGVATRVYEEARLHSDPASPWEGLILRVKPTFASEAPDSQLTDKNDTVSIHFIGIRRSREIFLRPLISLDERGLVDALSGSDSTEVVSVSPVGLKLTAGDVLWVNAAHAGSDRDPRVEYHLPENTESTGSHGFKTQVFGSDARISWRTEGDDFLPGEVLRLADLGVEQLRLKEPDSVVEALAWAEQDGRRGLLLWRERGGSGGVFGMMSLPLWRTGFQPAAGNTDKSAQARWVRGVSAWVRAQGGVRITIPPLLLAGCPFTLEARIAPVSGPFSLVDTAGVTHASGQVWTPGDTRENSTKEIRFEDLVFSAGVQNVAIRSAAIESTSVKNAPGTLWRGTLRVRAPQDVEWARLGTDEETLARMATASGGKILDAENFWPTFPSGQTRESRFRAIALAPTWPAVLVIASLLCALWALRKRFQID